MFVAQENKSEEPEKHSEEPEAPAHQDGNAGENPPPTNGESTNYNQEN